MRLAAFFLLSTPRPMSNTSNSAEALLESSVSEGIFECGVLGIVNAYGESHFCGYGLPEGVTETTALFDLASLSKVVATTSIAMRLVDEKRLDLDTPVNEYLPDFADGQASQKNWRMAVTPRMLLSHCAGFKPGHPFWKSENGSLEERKKMVRQSPLETLPGTVTTYSDIGMMIMGQIMERLTNKPLDVLAKNMVFSPLGMNSTCYNPKDIQHCIETEEQANNPGTFWKGVVHDENARWLGGVAGHAGVFSSVGDLAKLCRMLLEAGRGFVSEKVFDIFTAKAKIVADSSRCLGWDGWSQGCAGGTYASPNSFGHTGFTGTSIWIDPQNDIAVILLTNAVKPHRECKTANGYFKRRNEIHSLCYEP